jgi:hypothetical protein
MLAKERKRLQKILINFHNMEQASHKKKIGFLLDKMNSTKNSQGIINLGNPKGGSHCLQSACGSGAVLVLSASAYPRVNILNGEHIIIIYIGVEYGGLLF